MEPIVNPSEASGVSVEWGFDDLGRDYLVAKIEGEEMARRRFVRRTDGSFSTEVFPFSPTCPLEQVFFVGRALDFAERRLRHGEGAL